MKISKHFEYNEVRLEVILESRDLITHSNLCNLTEVQIEAIKYQLFLAGTYTMLQLNGQAEKWQRIG